MKEHIGETTKTARAITGARCAIALVTLIAMIVAVLPQPAGAAFPGINGRIYFSTHRDGDHLNIYSVDPTTVTPVTSNGDVHADPAAVNTAKDDWSPVWSPDNSLLAFTSTRSGDSEIYTFNAATGSVTQLTSNTMDDLVPTWSPVMPNGEMYIAWHQLTKRSGYDIMAMQSDGSHQQLLLGGGRRSDETHGGWHPNGSELTYTSDAIDRNLELYKVTTTVTGSGGLAAGSPQRLTSTRNHGEVYADYSPDGSEIVYSKAADANNYEATSDLWKMSSSGAGQAFLKDVGFMDFQPDWSPDGTKIAFASTTNTTNQTSEIYVTDEAGGSLTKITENGRGDYQPEWRALAP